MKASEMKCRQCGKGIFDGVALHRQNEKGGEPIWACDNCNTLPLDSEVKSITDAIQGKA